MKVILTFLILIAIAVSLQLLIDYLTFGVFLSSFITPTTITLLVFCIFLFSKNNTNEKKIFKLTSIACGAITLVWIVLFNLLHYYGKGWNH